MKKIILTLMAFLLVLPFALGVSLEALPINVNAGEAVTLTVGGCAEGATAFIRVFSPGEDAQLIDVFQGTIVDGTFKAVHIAQEDIGTYEGRGTCQGDSSVAKNTFCVATNTCGVAAEAAPAPAAASEPEPEAAAPAPAAAPVSESAAAPAAAPSGGGGGGSSRRAATLSSQASTCVPSWTCTSWSGCVDGKEQRSCIDEKRCNVATGKPVTERSCTISAAQQQETTAQQGSRFPAAATPAQRSLSVPQAEAEVLAEPIVKQPTSKIILWSVGIGALVVVLVLGVVLIIMKRKAQPV